MSIDRPSDEAESTASPCDGASVTGLPEAEPPAPSPGAGSTSSINDASGVIVLRDAVLRGVRDEFAQAYERAVPTLTWVDPGLTVRGWTNGAWTVTLPTEVFDVGQEVEVYQRTPFDPDDQDHEEDCICRECLSGHADRLRRQLDRQPNARSLRFQLKLVERLLEEI